MSTKTISLKLEAYKKLRAAKRYPGESFSEVVLRASWPEETITGADLLKRYQEHGRNFSDTGLARIEELKQNDQTPKDKWKRR